MLLTSGFLLLLRYQQALVKYLYPLFEDTDGNLIKTLYAMCFTANGDVVLSGEYSYFVEGSLRWKNRVLESVNEMVRLLSNATNNINQIAKRANETGNIYAADLDEICGRYDEIWKQTKKILRKLAEL